MDPVVLGEVIGVFGLRGELRVHLHHREGATLTRPRDVELILPEGRRIVRMSVRPGAGKRVLARVEGVETPEAAAALVGARIEVDRATLPPPEAGEYYVHDLLGATVVDETGAEHGVVTEVAAGPVDVWVLDEGAAFVVASTDAVRRVDLDARRIVVATGAVERG